MFVNTCTIWYVWYTCMNKTLYIRDEDAGLWDRARELADDKLSPFIVSAVKQFVAERESELKGFERIVVKYRDNSSGGIPKAKGFYGKWIIAPNEMDLSADDHLGRFEALAITLKGKVVVFSYITNGLERLNECFEIFDSLESAVSQFPDSACIAMERLGVPVEELDI